MNLLGYRYNINKIGVIVFYAQANTGQGFGRI